MTIFTILSYVLSSLPLICAAEVGGEVRKWILFAMGILSFIATLGVDCFRLYLRWKQAKADGIITKEESEQLQKDAAQIAEDLKGKGKGDNL